MSPQPSPAQLLKTASGKLTPILRQWLALKSAVAVLVCALFAVYYLRLSLSIEDSGGALSRIGAGAALVGFAASLQSVWSIWGRRRMPPLPSAIIAAAASPMLIAYWVWTAFLAG